jgi:hypothetical protein
MRNDIVGLLERRITAIDQKLVELSKKSGVETHEPIKIQQQRVIEKEEKIEEGKNRGGVRGESVTEIEGVVEEEGKSEEKNIEELQKEIVETLHRLDQAEVEDNEAPKSHAISRPTSFNDKSCLRQLR